MSSLTKQEQAEQLLSQNWKLWQQSKDYMSSTNFDTAIKEWVDFYEGRQWGTTKFSKTFPKITTNQIKKIIDKKVSNITASPIILNYRSSKEMMKTSKWNKFAEHQQKKMGMDTIIRRAVYDAIIKSTYFLYFYWDEKSVGSLGQFEGDLKCENIDIRNIGLANPKMKDIQKQKWVLIHTREEVKTVLAMVDDDIKEEEKELIVRDENQAIENDIEQDKEGLCSVLTRFFRIKGEVYFERSVKNLVINKPRPMNPLLVEKLIKELKPKEEISQEISVENEDNEVYDMDGQVATLQDNMLEKDTTNDDMKKFHLYPFEMRSLTERDNCAFGISEVEGLIYTQKSINLQQALTIKNARDFSGGKWVIKESALEDQEITDEIGQVIVDHTPIGTNGIRQEQPQQFGAGALELTGGLISIMESSTNANDIFSADNISKDLSGVAIAQLEEQNNKTTDMQHRNLMASMENVGKILELFYKFYYDKATFSFELNGMDKYTAATELGMEDDEVPDMLEDTFNGRDYLDTSFELNVEAGVGGRYSEIMNMSTINTLFLNGGMQNMTPEQLEILAQIYPEKYMTFKNELMMIIKKQKASENAMLKQNIQQLQELLQQAQMKIGQVEAYNEALQDEFSNKISVFNEEYKRLEKKNKVAEAILKEQAIDTTDGNNKSQ